MRKICQIFCRCSCVLRKTYNQCMILLTTRSFSTDSRFRKARTLSFMHGSVHTSSTALSTSVIPDQDQHYMCRVCGVSHGSVLRLILFLPYTADSIELLTVESSGLYPHLYADQAWVNYIYFNYN